MAVPHMRLRGHSPVRSQLADASHRLEAAGCHHIGLKQADGPLVERSLEDRRVAPALPSRHRDRQVPAQRGVPGDVGRQGGQGNVGRRVEQRRSDDALDDLIGAGDRADALAVTDRAAGVDDADDQVLPMPNEALAVAEGFVESVIELAAAAPPGR